MNDKKALLGKLSIHDNQRKAGNRMPRLLITGIGAIVLAGGAWFWLLPGQELIEVNTVAARPASGSANTGSDAVLDASGYVTARRQATVSSKFTGKVTEILIEEGVVVAQGQLLARLDDVMQTAELALAKARLQATESRLNEVEIQLQEAELAHRRTIELANRELASQADLDSTFLAVQGLNARLKALGAEIEVGRRSMKIQQQQLADTEIRAPFGGVVIAKAAQPGEMISPVSAGGGFTRTGICTIVDMTSLEIEVDVNESYINRVTPEQPVTATLNSYPDWQIPAKVITIIPTADRNKATVRVRIAFLESDSRILPDMGVKVSFLDDTIRGDGPAEVLTGVMIPENAVTSVDDESVVFVVDDGIVHRRTVHVGADLQGNISNITNGLQAGEKVVSNLSSELTELLLDGRRRVSTDMSSTR